MKQLFTLILLIATFIVGYSQKEFYDYIEGADPIILIATHGGDQYSIKITNRDCGKHTCVTDLNTDELLRQFNYHNELFDPHILIMNLEREEIDLNRPINEACANEYCETVYNSFHNKIEEIIKLYPGQKVLLLDIHGHSHKHGFIELGYNIPRIAYEKELINIKGSTINSISGITLEEAVRGYGNIGHVLNLFGYNTTPSMQNPIPPTPYFNGGYIVETYSQYKDVVAIQIELPYSVRETKESRKRFVKTFIPIVHFYYNNIKTR